LAVFASRSSASLNLDRGCVGTFVAYQDLALTNYHGRCASPGVLCYCGPMAIGDQISMPTVQTDFERTGENKFADSRANRIRLVLPSEEPEEGIIVRSTR
jgi:hypothetical protein